MLRHVTAACIFAVVLLVPQARADCPVGTTNPLQALTGVWTFDTEGFNFPPTNFLASVGRIVATIGADRAGVPVGVLSITQTHSNDGSPTRLTTDPGKFQVNADCSAGNLNFNTAGRADQYDFYFANPDEIVFNGSNNGDIVTGRAQRVSAGLVAPSCPANPLQPLVGTWTYSVNGFHFPPTLFLSAVGRLVASLGVDRAGAPIGVLSISQSSSIDGSPTRSESDIGRYALNADCSGGTLTFNLGSRPGQFDFFFNNPNTLLFVGTNNGDIVEGRATRVP